MNLSDLRRVLAATAVALPLCAPGYGQEDSDLDTDNSGAAEAYDKRGPAMQWWRDAAKTTDHRLEWWREARFGCFIHWGAYSAPGGVWRGQEVAGYAEHLMRVFELDNATYEREVAAPFNPVAFDADAWVTTIKNAGMKYLVITAKHHDGFAIWDSAVSDYDIVDRSAFGRDPIAELRDACDRHGLKLGFYYSHAQDWHHPQGTRADWQFDYPASRRPLWWKVAENRWHVDNVHQYFTDKAVPQIQELIEKYDPAIMWFDTAFWAPPEVTIRALEAARRAKPDLIVNSRVVTGGKGNYGDYESTSDKPAVFFPVEGDWEAIPTTNESYGYHQTDKSHKPAAHFIRLLSSAAARGGNLLMNLGPRGDGRIDPVDQEILAGIGDWLEANGPAIYATQRTPLPVQAWGQSTRDGDTLYLHVHDWPRDGRLIVGGLRSDITEAGLLAQPAVSLQAQRLDEATWQIDVPTDSPTPPVGVVTVRTTDAEDVEEYRLIQPTAGVNVLHTYDGRLVGRSIRYGKGHADDDYLERWTGPDDGVDWSIRLREPATLRVQAKITAQAKKTGGRFAVTVGDQTLEADVPETGYHEPTTVDLGRLELPAGRYTLSVRAVQITPGRELMNLHELHLRPTAGEAQD